MPMPDAARRERNRRLAITTGILVLLAVVIATGVWVTSGSSTTPDPAAARTPAAHVGDHSLVVGAAAAPVKVVVYEDFLCPFCRQLETSTRDFLHQDAAKGRVQVEPRRFAEAKASEVETDGLGVVLRGHDPSLHERLEECPCLARGQNLARVALEPLIPAEHLAGW